MNLLRQITSFAGVGSCATLSHIGVAWSLMELSPLDPFVANLIGACTAYFVSFFGNAFLTFRVRKHLLLHAFRYLLISTVSLILTSIELAIVTFLDLPILAYVLIVLVTVPPATFLFAKFWAFAAPRRLPAEQPAQPDHRGGPDVGHTAAL